MNILLLCTKFSMDENDPWLTNELAGSLQRAGNRVTVLCLDWAGKLGSEKSAFFTPFNHRKSQRACVF